MPGEQRNGHHSFVAKVITFHGRENQLLFLVVTSILVGKI